MWIFQEGHLRWLLHFQPGPLEPALPVLLFCTLFGLSMDYQVLMLSRMREEWSRTHDNRDAVAQGLEQTGSLITSAAAIMVAVFAGVRPGEDPGRQGHGRGDGDRGCPRRDLGASPDRARHHAPLRWRELVGAPVAATTGARGTRREEQLMSTVLVGLAILSLLLLVEGHVRLRRVLARRPAPPPFPSSAPSVTVVRPVKGLDTGAEDNIRAFLDMEYPGQLELLFVVDSEQDPATPAICGSSPSTERLRTGSSSSSPARRLRTAPES